MPYKIRKLPNKNLYRVRDESNNVKAYGTSKTKADRQIKLLEVMMRKEKKVS